MIPYTSGTSCGIEATPTPAVTGMRRPSSEASAEQQQGPWPAGVRNHVDVARDSAGRWRHPARPRRIRADVDVQEVPLFGEGDTLP